MKHSYTGLIKKYGDHYVALCPELNVASQGESLEEARRMLHDACYEYLTYIKEEERKSELIPATIDTLREFLKHDKNNY
ncbi:MAG: type II toxin-antitoxin system HicB family antitoxin [Candidatus Brocadiales bacterium]